MNLPKSKVGLNSEKTRRTTRVDNKTVTIGDINDVTEQLLLMLDSENMATNIVSLQEWSGKALTDDTIVLRAIPRNEVSAVNLLVLTIGTCCKRNVMMVLMDNTYTHLQQHHHKQCYGVEPISPTALHSGAKIHIIPEIRKKTEPFLTFYILRL